jgi:hypothetical protein
MGILIRADDGGKGKKAVYKLAFSPYKEEKVLTHSVGS